MRTKDLKEFILYTFGRRRFYGYEVHRELELKGIKVGIGRLYGILGGMLSEGLLSDKWERSQSGPKKRIYRLSKKGHEVRNSILLEAIKAVHKFYIEYLVDLPPELNPFTKVSDLITSKLRSEETLVCLSPVFSKPVAELVAKLTESTQDGDNFLVLPGTAGKDVSVDKWQVLDGTFDHIPLKEAYVNAILVVGFRKEYSEDRTMQEWSRLLAKGGTIALTTPSVLIQEQKDPLAIGTFIEKYEHHAMNQSLDWKVFLSKIKDAYKTVKEVSIANLTTILATGPRKNISKT
jgi:DNA-binding PadR family transcriptional regulator